MSSSRDGPHSTADPAASLVLQDFVSSVSTLLTVRQGTVHLRHRIGELDSQMGEVGRALMAKVRSFLFFFVAAPLHGWQN